MHIDETICALSTPAGKGAIALIRISGKEALSVCGSVITLKGKKEKLTEQPGNSIHLGLILNNSEPIDEVLISVFRNPHSYTGEDLVEISCHGSVYIQQKILEALISAGARQDISTRSSPV